MKVALIHDYLLQYGGAEKTLDAICELYPEADIYTGLYNSKNMSETINKHKVFHIKSPFIARFSKIFTFLMPLVFENFDLRAYDLIISDGSAWAKGVLTTPNQLHISYVHTPPRFLYGYSVESQKRDKWYFKPVVTVLDYILRLWDFHAAQRPDFLLTNSKETEKRINKFYRREAKVIYPPVEVKSIADFKEEAKNVDLKQKFNIEGEYFLALGRIVAYKNFDFLVKAFNVAGKTLVVAGTGPEENTLKNIASKNIIFAGRVTELEKAALLYGCTAVINSVEDEDLGIVPIEAQAAGKPVLAHRSGGHLETIQEGKTGIFFDDFEIQKFVQKLDEIDEFISSGTFSPTKSIKNTQKYNKERFKEEISDFVKEKLNARTS